MDDMGRFVASSAKRLRGEKRTVGLDEETVDRHRRRDLAEPGPQDMIARIVGDFAANGIYVTNREIGSRLGQTEQLVRAELLGAD